MELPTIKDIKNLHEKYAPNEYALQTVWTHSEIVKDIAVQLANGKQLNVDLATVGALLHDIGAYDFYTSGKININGYIKHGMIGYEILKSEGYSEELCRFALLHTGVGISKEDVKQHNLPIPYRDYFAETIEEKLVMYADKFHSKTEPPVFYSADSFSEQIKNKFGEDKANKFTQFINEFGAPDLSALVEKYGYELK